MAKTEHVRGHKRKVTVENNIGSQGGYKVILRNTMYPRGYVGMNWWAAKELNIPFYHNKKTVVVWSGLSRKDRILTTQHEIDEAQLMAGGMKYSEAHKRVQLLENLGLKRRIGDETVPTSPKPPNP